MPALNFPVRPPPGTVHGAWRWDGRKWDRQLHGLSPGGTRVGTLADWSDWPTLPSRWLICDGREVSREEYPPLFSVIGTTHGAGDGDTTFNLPDVRARVTVGWDTDATGRLTVSVCGLDPAILGAVGGDERSGAHSHPATAIPAHAHGLNDPGHGHGVWQVGHSHGVADPTHAHGFPQNHHGHGQDGGWHNHGWQGGNHGHGQRHGWLQDSSEPWAHWYLTVVNGQVWTSHVGTGVANHGAGIGVWTGGNYAWISVDANWTQQWVDWGNADVGVYGNYTGVTLQDADAAPGMVVETNEDPGDTANIAPSIVVPKLIFAGWNYAAA